MATEFKLLLFVSMVAICLASDYPGYYDDCDSDILADNLCDENLPPLPLPVPVPPGGECHDFPLTPPGGGCHDFQPVVPPSGGGDCHGGQQVQKLSLTEDEKTETSKSSVSEKTSTVVTSSSTAETSFSAVATSTNQGSTQTKKKRKLKIKKLKKPSSKIAKRSITEEETDQEMNEEDSVDFPTNEQEDSKIVENGQHLRKVEKLTKTCGKFQSWGPSILSLDELDTSDETLPPKLSPKLSTFKVSSNGKDDKMMNSKIKTDRKSKQIEKDEQMKHQFRRFAQRLTRRRR